MPKFCGEEEREALMKLCLIPAAGFGKRLGGPPAKEILIDPENNRPIIDWSLELALKYALKPIVITRKSKTSLISYIEDNWLDRGVELMLVEASKEWPDSILQSQNLWSEVNLMILPDTRFAPQELVEKLISDCEFKNQASFGFFDTKESLETWGVLGISEGKSLQICEKPFDLVGADQFKAWGLIAFRKEVGKELFASLLKSNQDHQWFQFSHSCSTHKLNYFKDITRKVSDLEF